MLTTYGISRDEGALQYFPAQTKLPNHHTTKPPNNQALGRSRVKSLTR